jgi:GT2 family glycosyltransferase
VEPVSAAGALGFNAFLTGHMTPLIDVVIVNWNTGDELRSCLESLASANRIGFRVGRVVVVDNASTDGSCEQLDVADLPLAIIRNVENRGFAAACNQGAAGTNAKYLLFLNPDTRLFSDSLSQPIDFMERKENGNVGICGIKLVDSHGRPMISCARFPTPMTFVAQVTGLSQLWPRMFRPQLLSADECAATRDVDQIIGAFYLVRRALFDLLRGFDERFFVYFEEVDFALRARLNGYRSVFLAAVEAQHRGGLSSNQVRSIRLFYSLRSRLAYGFKHYSRPGFIVLVIVTIALEPVARIARALARWSIREVADTLQGYLALLAYFTGLRLL